MYRSMNKYIEKMGFNPQKLTIMNKIALILHLLPALMEDGHCISIGIAGISKTTTIKNSSLKSKEICNFTAATLFGNINKKEKGVISAENNLVYIEQISALKIADTEVLQGILTHCNGDSYNRITENDNSRTSIVILGNPEKLIISENKEVLEFSTDFFNVLPKEIAEEQGMERFIVLPSFLMKKIEPKEVLSNSNIEELAKEIDSKRRQFKEYRIESENIREYKKKCKIIETLNYFLNNDKEVNEEIINGFYEVAKSITNLKGGKYIPFYYKNESGRQLALKLIEEYFPNNYTIEEAYFYKERALVKFVEEDSYWKIALTNKGIEENINEFEYFKKAENKENLVKINELLKEGLIIKQKYFPILSDYLKVKILNGSKDILINYLRKENERQKKKISLIEKKVNQLIQTIICIGNVKYTNIIIPEVFLPFIEENKELQDILISKLSKEISYKVRKSDVVIIDEKLVLLNFHYLHNLK